LAGSDGVVSVRYLVVSYENGLRV